MVGIPGTQERLALAEVEDRLRRIRARFNLYTFQHNLYSFGTVCALGTALLIITAFTLPPSLFTVLSWPLLAVAVFCFLFFLRRLMRQWTDLRTAALRIDAQAGLKDRLSTLVAQLRSGVIGKPPPSRLWPYLVEDNTACLPYWEIKKVAPRRVPWSVLPFLAALLIALGVALIPLLSPSSEPEPFSLANIQALLSELPDRAQQLLDRHWSLLPDPPTNWGGSSVFDRGGTLEGKATGQFADSQQRSERTADQQELRALASLPEALQKAIRQALQGLPPRERDNRQRQDTPPPSTQLALIPNEANKQADFAISGTLPKGAQQRPSTRSSRAADGKDGPSSGQGTEAGSQGSGIKQLSRARLDRKNARGTFQPESPHMPGSGDQAGAGGPGAGSGTDPRLFGNQTPLGGRTHTFQLALDAAYERGGASETEEEEIGDIAEKSNKDLSRRQSLDDAIRKSRIPAEYEEIVKRLFSRGESQ
ncbi:MAG: PRA1 family protein [Candidatus Binatia bacterium]|nr:PRA1 family protein [Candidatus Binatia bacterium]